MDRSSLDIAKQVNGCFIVLRASDTLLNDAAKRIAAAGLKHVADLRAKLHQDWDVHRFADAEPILEAMRIVLHSVAMGSIGSELNRFGLMDALHRAPNMLVSSDQAPGLVLEDIRDRLVFHGLLNAPEQVSTARLQSLLSEGA